MAFNWIMEDENAGATDSKFGWIMEGAAPDMSNFQLGGPISRGFFEKVGESLKRGRTQSLSDIGVSNALDDPNLDLEGALRLQNKLNTQQVLDPVDGNWLADFVYAGAQTAGQMYENIRFAGWRAGVGAAVGGVGSAALGAVIPTVGEEAITIGAGASAGAKFAGGSAAAIFSYRQGRGSMYGALIQDGIEPELAEKVASYAALPYAGLEMLQLKAAAPAIKKSLAAATKKTTLGIVKRAVKTYGSRLSQEVLEEIGQEIVQVGAEDTAQILQGNGIEVDADYIKERASRLWETAKGAAKAMALIPMPGVAIETAISATYDADTEKAAELQGTEPFSSEQQAIYEMGAMAPDTVYRDEEGNLVNVGTTESVQSDIYQEGTEELPFDIRNAETQPVGDGQGESLLPVNYFTGEIIDRKK